MKSIKFILISTCLILSVFCLVWGTACTKDTCKTTTCINGGNCSGGACFCKNGIGGVNCEVIYRDLYSYSYKGTGADSKGKSYPENIMTFTAGVDTAYTQMGFSWNNSGVGSVNLALTLTNNTPSGSSFTLGSVTVDTFTYTGTGSFVNNVSASVTLIESHPHSPSVTILLHNFLKQ
jgi:hypothetical protein